jgi:hypothetical protein
VFLAGPYKCLRDTTITIAIVTSTFTTFLKVAPGPTVAFDAIVVYAALVIKAAFAVTAELVRVTLTIIVYAGAARTAIMTFTGALTVIVYAGAARTTLAAGTPIYADTTFTNVAVWATIYTVPTFCIRVYYARAAGDWAFPMTTTATVGRWTRYRRHGETG